MNHYRNFFGISVFSGYDTHYDNSIVFSLLLFLISTIHSWIQIGAKIFFKIIGSFSSLLNIIYINYKLYDEAGVSSQISFELESRTPAADVWAVLLQLVGLACLVRDISVRNMRKYHVNYKVFRKKNISTN